MNCNPLCSSPANWQKILRTNFIQWEKLADFLELSPAQRAEIQIKPKFSLNLPMRLAKKIVKGTLDDPILRQFLPTKKENIEKSAFVTDPIGDCAARIQGKLLHKYKERALLLCTSACAMHCRYCFRQNFDYETTVKTFDHELKAIAEDDTLREIILSGGDPLSLNNQCLEELVNKLASIQHLRRIRFHSRFPLGIPERIDLGLLNIVKKCPLQTWFVIHCNHPVELDEDVLAHLKLLQKQGAVLLNQSVLLRGVNDSVAILKKLSERLVDHGILPYYLHQLDRVSGSSHFEVEQEYGKVLIGELNKQLSGYAVPKYVKEIPGESSKIGIY